MVQRALPEEFVIALMLTICVAGGAGSGVMGNHGTVSLTGS